MQIEDLSASSPHRGRDMIFPEHCVEQLRATGLIVHKSYDADHVLCDGFTIAKPKSLKGNSIPGCEDAWGSPWESNPLIVDAPFVVVHSHGDRWIVTVFGAGGSYPGDFRHEFNDPEQALADVLKYYFGDSLHFQERLCHHTKMTRRLADDSQRAPPQ
jgi:hypothetical protein